MRIQTRQNIVSAQRHQLETTLSLNAGGPALSSVTIRKFHCHAIGKLCPVALRIHNQSEQSMRAHTCLQSVGGGGLN